jgi:hypothetical protein
MRAHGMQAKENKDQGVGNPGEEQPMMKPSQDRNRGNTQGVLEVPGGAIVRMDGQHQPPHAKDNSQDEQISPMRNGHTPETTQLGASATEKTASVRRRGIHAA